MKIFYKKDLFLSVTQYKSGRLSTSYCHEGRTVTAYLCCESVSQPLVRKFLSDKFTTANKKEKR